MSQAHMQNLMYIWMGLTPNTWRFNIALPTKRWYGLVVAHQMEAWRASGMGPAAEQAEHAGQGKGLTDSPG